MNNKFIALGQAARDCAVQLALIDSQSKNHALRIMARKIRRDTDAILKANQKDLRNAQDKQHSAAFLDRLSLDEKRIEAMAQSLEAIAALPDPVGRELETQIRPNGLEITRVSVPIGVIGVIYESRPNVTADVAGLCLKSGNAVIMRGGSESFFSSQAILHALHEGLREADLPITAVQMIPTQDRAAVDEMLKMDQYIDVIIPRGGLQLVEYIANHTRIPLFKHLAGLCHTYVHTAADKEMARKLLLNAKMRRTGICGATEILLIDEAIVRSHLPVLLDDLIQAGCEVRGDQTVVNLDPRVKLATDKDYDTEFLEAIIAVKVVKDIAEAISHIRIHSTQHTDAIVTEDLDAADQFIKQVDSAIVMHNASTQFADGGEFGMGAEIGIATGKLHARGPVGAAQLTTFKYVVRGQGQIR